MDQPEGIEDDPPYEVVEFFYGRGIDSEFSIICRRHRFIVRISQDDIHEEDPQQLSNIESDYNRILTAVSNDDPSGIEDLNPENYDPLEVMYDWVATPFFPLFSKLPSIDEDPQRLQSLHEYANPPTSHYRLKVVEGRITPILDDDDEEPSLLRAFHLPASSVYPDVLTVSPQDIQIPWDSLSEGAQYPRTVLLNRSQKFYFKSAVDHESAQREIDILHRILELDLHKTHRLPKLHAYVRYENDEGIAGYLLEYIDHQNVLSDKIAGTASVALRRNWYRNITNTLIALHDAGIVWGDVKADNVLIDHGNQAWVIDFGGGHTDGWVDQDLRETIAGDLQGLSRIMAHLNLR